MIERPIEIIKRDSDEQGHGKKACDRGDRVDGERIRPQAVDRIMPPRHYQS